MGRKDGSPQRGEIEVTGIATGNKGPGNHRLLAGMDTFEEISGGKR